ncbi:hypothetical protein RZS28_10080 [Methylocapsa polymorpha]|uniref:Lysozyme inhibitor LprI N-terminal domain-containing protein n=1 Tax=Methylocapsa polymorpha TaxID=3080828 RepID=A0ABZ0HNL1_9HYPH|nr:hypothetical protein RZS28_10080 [Methylocapsa sp. RX1]
MLPGALQAAPPTGSEAPKSDHPAAAGPAKLKPLGLKPPGDGTIVGRDLLRDGSTGLIAFQHGAGKGIEITRLLLAGEAISRPSEDCRVEVVAAAPIETKFVGQPNGLARYDVEVEACPFSLEVLDGAVVVTRPQGACEFAAADCRADPAGFWGPAADSIDAGQIKQMERARGLAEANMRANFRALLASAGKDKAAIKKIAGEQAGFSSQREMICRNYLREDVHGFCALRITQARALALQAEFEAKAKTREDEKSIKAEIKKKPKL